MAGRPKVVETPEFQEAVSEAVAKQMEAFKKDLLAAATAPAPAAGGGVTDILSEVLSKLSMNMQALGQQGQHNKPRSPEQIVRCEEAHNRMVDLIIASRDLPKDDPARPAYRVTSKVYLNERFIEPFRMDPATKKAVPIEIVWTGVPNDAMMPINDTAKGIFAAWRESTGHETPDIPTADRRPLYVTAAGLVVRGDPPKRQHVAGEPAFQDGLSFGNNDPTAPEVAVLGTVAPKARQNQVQGVQ